VNLSVEAARFDWYGATVETPPGVLVEMGATVLADEAPVPVPGVLGYGHGWELRREGSRAAVVYGGGSQEYPFIVGSGEDAVRVAEFVRSRQAVHRVARADVCVDTDTAGAFGFLVDGLRSVLGGTRAYVIQPDHPEDGATYYAGSKASEVRSRLYEKGRQLQDAERPDWVRYEVQVRPQKGRKAWAATASEDALLGASRWSRRFASEVLGLAAAAPPTRSERVSDLDGALQAMWVQYGGRMRELLEMLDGDAEAFGVELVARGENGGSVGAA